MSWRRGEVWLDPELSWFREVPAVAAVAAPLPTFGLAPGLGASRVRRAVWKQRREARRARATAIAMSPAVMLAVAGLRGGGYPTSASPAEDPPSLELTLGADTGRALRELHPLPRVIGAAELERAIAAQAEAGPTIDWHHAVSLGLPYDGSLIDGTQLPVEGPDWVTWDPVTDNSPNLPRRLYGNERTIRAIVAVTAAYRAAHPQAPRVVIGDISREGGGPMWDEHVSHQNGLDVDVYLPRLDRKLRAPVAEDQVDHQLAQDLVDRFVAAGAKVIFVGYSTGLHGPAGVVVPYAGHEYHMHVRFPRPGG
jgi:murein endopeptidase